MSEEKSIEQRVKELLEEQLGESIERMEHRASLVEDLGCDSLDFVEITMAVEDEFKLEPTDDDVEKWRTVGDLIRYVEGAMQ